MWDEVIKMSKENNIEPAKLSRKKKQKSMRLQVGGHQHQELQIKDYYRISIYFSIFHTIQKEIKFGRK